MFLFLYFIILIWFFTCFYLLMANKKERHIDKLLLKIEESCPANLW